MPLPIEVGTMALEAIKKKIPEQMFGSEGDDVFVEVTGKNFKEFYVGVLNSYIRTLKLLEKEPNLEDFSELSLSFAKYENVLNSQKEKFKDEKEAIIFLSLMDSAYKIIKSYMDDYRLKKFN